ncbi:hypothetical protein NUH86_03920 [Sphingobium sp. JS3065]|uniref:hypothetical protein n=1 Tax=Sphingobium sp. JS3065 TaxID=2970925 RepID=UPI00226400C4|nr:hypothetical protein [Sphingobium sp. JS3065]UZW55950.1 hypothetical protein NUH86_03920 [Sphingobium sp. JS3065]
MSQANAARITGDTIFAPGKSDHSAVSRRAALTALAVVPAVAVAGTLPAQAAPDNWTLAVRAYRAAEAAYHGHLANVWYPLLEKVEKRCGPPPSLSVTIERPNGRPDTFVYRPAQPDAWMWHPTVAGRAAGEKLTAEWAEWHERDARTKDQFGFDAVDDEDKRLYACVDEARDRLMLTPAPDAAAVLMKLEIMWDDPLYERSEENERLITRDLRLLAALGDARRAA